MEFFIFNLKKIFFFFPKIYRKYFLILVVFIFFGASLEMIGLSLVFPIITFLISGDKIDYLFNIDFLKNLFLKKDGSSYIILVSIITCCFYFFKSIYSLSITFFNFLFINSFRYYLTDKLFKKYLELDYEQYSEKNTSVLIKNCI